MAIVVEEEQRKNGQGFGGLIAWGIIFVILAVAVYYVFFKRPELVDVGTPAAFRNTQVLSQINLAPDEVINSEEFRALRSYTQPIVIPSGGKANPFLGNF